MNPNISIYRWLNPKLPVQAGMGLDLLHWANMSNITLTKLSKIDQCNRPKPISTCNSSLGFSRLYILMLGFM